MACESCGAEAANDGPYCPACAEALARCARCGARNPSHYTYCADCGSRLRGAETAQLFASDAASGRSRRLTLMFCDLVGSTGLSMRLDPEELREHVRLYRAHCAGVIRRHGGEIAQFQGDGIIVCFGGPDSRGDHPDRAVRAGIDILAGLSALNSTLAHPILIRIGIHTGIVVIDERELFGAAPGVAARIQASAAPNQVAISEQTRQALNSPFQCELLTTETTDTSMPRIYLVRGIAA